MKKILLYVLSFLFIGCSVVGGAVIINYSNSLKSNFINDENDSSDIVDANFTVRVTWKAFYGTKKPVIKVYGGLDFYDSGLLYNPGETSSGWGEGRPDIYVHEHYVTDERYFFARSEGFIEQDDYRVGGYGFESLKFSARSSTNVSIFVYQIYEVRYYVGDTWIFSSDYQQHGYKYKLPYILDGKLVKGYSTNLNGDIEYLPGEDFGLDKDVNLYAVLGGEATSVSWDGDNSMYSMYWNYAGVNGYNIDTEGVNNYYSKSASNCIASSYLELNSKPKSCPIPYKPGYIFCGWKNEDNVQIFDENGQIIPNTEGYTDLDGMWTRTDATTLYAMWELDTFSLTVTDGEEEISTNLFTINDYNSINITTPSKAGYEFTGWTIKFKLDMENFGFINEETGEQQFNVVHPNSKIFQPIYISTNFTYSVDNSNIIWLLFNNSNYFPTSFDRSQTVSEIKVDSNMFLILVNVSDNFEQQEVSIFIPSNSSLISLNSGLSLNSLRPYCDIECIANFEGNVYEITLDKEGGSGGTDSFYIKVGEGWYSNSDLLEQISVISLPSKLCYKFSGYYYNDDYMIINEKGQIIASPYLFVEPVILYARWTANNPAYYDEEGGYWYIENGTMPQSKVTNTTTWNYLNSNWSSLTNGNMYFMGAIGDLQSKVYNGNEYCTYNGEYYLVEPIKWRLEYSSSQTSGYGTTTDTLAVMDTIVYVDRYSTSAINAGYGYSWRAVDGLYDEYNTENHHNQIDSTYLVRWTQSMPTFGTTSLYGTPTSPSASIFVSSVEEIEQVAGGGAVKFSDLVSDFLKSTGNGMLYYTRDLGTNYNNIICLNENGDRTQRKPNLTANRLGVQFTIKVTEYACV